MGELRWANKLAEWRAAADLTVHEAADGLGVSAYIYRRWELGEIEPTAGALTAMPKTFGITTREVRRLVETKAAG